MEASRSFFKVQLQVLPVVMKNISQDNQSPGTVFSNM